MDQSIGNFFSWFLENLTGILKLLVFFPAEICQNPCPKTLKNPRSSGSARCFPCEILLSLPRPGSSRPRQLGVGHGCEACASGEAKGRRTRDPRGINDLTVLPSPGNHWFIVGKSSPNGPCRTACFKLMFYHTTRLWLQTSGCDLNRLERTHAGTGPWQWLKTRCYDLTLPLVVIYPMLVQQ